MKTLHISPRDVGLDPLGLTSPVADVEVKVAPDRDVALNDGTFIAGGVPLVETSIPTEGLDVAVLANDDSSITRGARFALDVTLTYWPRRGSHGKAVTSRRRITITSADPDVVPYASKAAADAIPYYVDATDLSGVAWWTNPDGERVPVMVAPVAGNLTVLGGHDA